MLAIKLLTAGLCFGIMSTVETTQKMETLHEWKYVEFEWKNDDFKNRYLRDMEWGVRNATMIDVDTWKDGRVFVTMIRTEGTVASLGTVSNQTGKGGPLVRPYPSWDWASPNNCSSIINAFRITIDECDRLWVVDNGHVGEKLKCPAKLLVFDLHTDSLIGTHEIPEEVAKNSKTDKGWMITPVVDTEGDRCEKTHVYMSDVTGHGLVIFNNGTFWRLESPVFEPVPTAANVHVNGSNFQLLDGVIGMALGPRKCSGDPRNLVFRPFSSFDVVSAKTSDLENSNPSCPITYTTASRVLPSQAAAIAISSQNVLFLVPVTETTLSCWNLDNPINKENMVNLEHDPVRYQFASGVKIIPKERTGRAEELWILTNRYHRYVQKNQNSTEINYRIMTATVDNLIANTDCQSKYSLSDLFSPITCLLNKFMGW